MRSPGRIPKPSAARLARALKQRKSAKPESAAPESATPNAAKPRSAKPRSAKPRSAKRRAADPNAATPNAAKSGRRRPGRALVRALATRHRDLPGRAMAKLAERDRRRLAPRLVIALVLVEGAGAAAALAVLPSDSIRSEFPVAGGTSAAAAPWRFAEGQLVADSRSTPRRAGPSYYAKTASRHVSASVEAGFMPVYREAARTFGVSWRLLASVHRQETAFSSVASTYHGLNAFGCCAGPMQFNVTNGPPSTWGLYRNSFRKGDRPRRYPHPTRHHPSIYDDFDAIMAAAALLRDGGAGEALDGGAWSAAYAYYGHDSFGTEYASQVVGRAQTWERDGFCLNCSEDASLVAALDDVYGVDARRVLRAAEEKKDGKKKKKKKKKKSEAEKVAEQAREEAARARREARRDDSEREAGRTTPQPPPAAAPADPSTTTTSPTTPTATTEAPPAPPPPAPPPCTGMKKLLGCG